MYIHVIMIVLVDDLFLHVWFFAIRMRAQPLLRKKGLSLAQTPPQKGGGVWARDYTNACAYAHRVMTTSTAEGYNSCLIMY